MDYFYMGFEYFWCLIEAILFTLFFKRLLGLSKKIIPRLYFLMFIFISIIIFTLTITEINQGYRIILGTGVYFIYSLTFDGGLTDKIFYNLIFNLVQIAGEVVTMSMLRLIFKIPVNDIILIYGTTRILAGIIIKFFKYALLRIIIDYIKPQENILPSKYNVLVWAVYGMSIISLLLLFDLTRDLEIGQELSTLLIFICSSFLFMNAAVYVFIEELNKHYIKQKDRAIIEMHYKATERYLKMNEETNLQIRKIRHDIKNHINNIKYLVSDANNKTDEYINAIQEDIEKLPISVKTGNEFADIVLNQRKVEAEGHNIDFKVNAVIPPHISINQVDLSSLLFNSIDNAIEANLKINDKQIRKIEIDIYPKKDYLYFEIRNSIPQDLKRVERGITRKKNRDKHGYGLIILEDITKKYNGFINYEIEAGEFKLYMAISLDNRTTSITEKATSLT